MKSIVEIISNSDLKMFYFSPFRDTKMYFRVSGGDLVDADVFSRASDGTRWNRRLNELVNMIHIKTRAIEKQRAIEEIISL